MRTLSAWTLALIASSTFPAACAAVSTTDSVEGAGGGKLAEGSGGNDSTGTGSQDGSGSMSASGSASSSGGASTGTGSGSSVIPMGGAGNPLIEDCKDGETSSCAEHSPLYPAGIATCMDGAWDILGCLKCEPNEVLNCADVVPRLPEGSVTCNADGTDYTENPKSVCLPCVKDEETACDNPANTTANTAGSAVCQGAAGYDWGSCHLCEAGVTEIECIKIVGTGKVYSAGTAVCDSTGDAYDDAGCEWCGDGALQGTEECDPGMPDTTTCEAIGWDGDPSAVECTEECVWNRRSCSRCPGPDCMTSDCDNQTAGTCDGMECDGSCTFNCDYGKATCDDVVCGNGSTCDFKCASGDGDPGGCSNVACDPHSTCTLNCGNGGGNCDATVCEIASNCEFDCSNGGSCQDVECTGASCSFVCTNTPSTCSTASRFVCAEGETCTFDCGNGGDCSGLQATCAEGSTCEIICNNNGPGCADVICEAGADCTLNCDNAECPSVVIN